MRKRVIFEECIEIPELLNEIERIKTTIANNIAKVDVKDILVDMLKNGTFRFVAINKETGIRYFAYCNIDSKRLQVTKFIKMNLYTNEIIK